MGMNNMKSLNQNIQPNWSTITLILLVYHDDSTEKSGNMSVLSRPDTSDKLRNCTRMIFLCDTQQSTHLCTAFPRGRESGTDACCDEAAFCRGHNVLSTDCKERCSENREVLRSPILSDSTRKSGGYSSEQRACEPDPHLSICTVVSLKSTQYYCFISVKDISQYLG